MKFFREILVGGATVIAVAMVITGESDKATAIFLAVLGYFAGKQDKLNGELVALVAKKK